jgi:hypothetical protein
MLSIAAFPAVWPKISSQRVYWRLNGGEWQGPTQMTADLTYALGIVHVKEGTNLLSFHLPDAHQMNAGDLRVIAIGLRSLRMDCSDGDLL